MIAPPCRNWTIPRIWNQPIVFGGRKCQRHLSKIERRPWLRVVHVVVHCIKKKDRKALCECTPQSDGHIPVRDIHIEHKCIYQQTSIPIAITLDASQFEMFALNTSRITKISCVSVTCNVFQVPIYFVCLSLIGIHKYSKNSRIKMYNRMHPPLNSGLNALHTLFASFHSHLSMAEHVSLLSKVPHAPNHIRV